MIRCNRLGRTATQPAIVPNRCLGEGQADCPREYSGPFRLGQKADNRPLAAAESMARNWLSERAKAARFMVKEVSRILGAALAVVIASPKTGLAQSEAETVRSLLSGRTMMITYRYGGPINGTYQQIYVSFCPSGSYFSQGGNSRTTVLENQERRSFSNQGTWSVSELENLVVVQYRSVSGQVTAFERSGLAFGCGHGQRFACGNLWQVLSSQLLPNSQPARSSQVSYFQAATIQIA